jgi:hypothetical protein
MKNISSENVVNSTTVVTTDEAMQVKYKIPSAEKLSLSKYSLVSKVIASFNKDYRCGMYAALIASNIKEKVSLNTYIPYEDLGESIKKDTNRPTLSIDKITKNHIAILSDCSTLPKKFLRPDKLSMIYVEGKERVKETFICNKGIAVVEASMYGKYAFKIDTEISYLLKKSDSEKIISKVASVLSMTSRLNSEHLVCSITGTEDASLVLAKFTATVRFPDYVNSWRPFLAYHVPGINKEVMDTIESFGKEHYCMRGDIQKSFYRSNGYFNIELNSPFETLIISSAQAYYSYGSDYTDVRDSSKMTEIYNSVRKNQTLVPGFKMRIKENGRYTTWLIIS